MQLFGKSARHSCPDYEYDQTGSNNRNAPGVHRRGVDGSAADPYSAKSCCSYNRAGYIQNIFHSIQFLFSCEPAAGMV